MKTKILKSVVAVAGVLCAAGCADMQLLLHPSGGVQTKAEPPVTIISLPHVANKRLYPGVHLLPDNRLVVYSGGGVRISTDGGRSWEKPAGALPRTGMLGKTDDAALVRNFRPPESGGEIVWKLDDLKDGKVVDRRNAYVSGVPGISQKSRALGGDQFIAGEFCPNDRAVEMPDGSFLLTAYTEFVGDREDRTILLRSSNGGRSFEYAGTVATGADASWGHEGPDESALALLNDGSLLCVMRVGGATATDSTSLLQARSTDGGKTWGHYRSMPVAGVFPQLVVLENGVIVCGTGRPGNRVIFSADNGKTWGSEIELSSADVATSGYLHLAAIGTDRVFAVYEISGAHTSSDKIWLWDPPPPQDCVMGVSIEARPLNAEASGQQSAVSRP